MINELRSKKDLDQSSWITDHEKIKDQRRSRIKDQRSTFYGSRIKDHGSSESNQKKNTDQRSTSNQVFEDQRSKKDQRYQKSVIEQSTAKKLKR